MNNICILNPMQDQDQDQRSTRAEFRTIAHILENAGKQSNPER